MWSYSQGCVYLVVFVKKISTALTVKSRTKCGIKISEWAPFRAEPLHISLGGGSVRFCKNIIIFIPHFYYNIWQTPIFIACTSFRNIYRPTFRGNLFLHWLSAFVWSTFLPIIVFFKCTNLPPPLNIWWFAPYYDKVWRYLDVLWRKAVTWPDNLTHNYYTYSPRFLFGTIHYFPWEHGFICGTVFWQPTLACNFVTTFGVGMGCFFFGGGGGVVLRYMSIYVMFV